MAERWTESQVKQILTMLALNAGNLQKTANEFKADNGGVGPTRDTIAGWRDRKYADMYAKIRDEYAQEFEMDVVRGFRDRMRQAAEVEALAIQRALEQLEMNRVSSKDLAAMAYNMARIKANNADRLLALTGRPTQIIDDRSAQKVIDGLVRRKILKVVSNEGSDSDNTEAA